MNQPKRLKIHNIPTAKLVIMIDVSRQELNKLLKKQKIEGSLPEDLEKELTLWKHRYAVSTADLRRRVNDQFNKIYSNLSLREEKKPAPIESKEEPESDEDLG